MPHAVLGAVRQGVKTGTGGEHNVQFPPLQWSLGPKIPQPFTRGPVMQTHKPVWDILDSHHSKVTLLRGMAQFPQYVMSLGKACVFFSPRMGGRKG